IDAEVELVVHPGGIGLVGQKRQRPVDEIVVIEQPAALLLVRIPLQHLVGHGQKRGAAIAGGGGAAACKQSADALLFSEETFAQRRVTDRLRENGLARRPWAARAEYVEIGVDAVGGGMRRKAREAIRLLAVGLSAQRQDSCNRR